MSKFSLRSKNDGFTLVELSIVLIIIGFLIAGITAGTSLVKTAEINSVINDFRTYQTAYNNFLARYGQAPGDYNNGAAVWSSVLTTDACNGNGNGVIGAANSTLEVMTAVVELSQAGMIGASIAAPDAACATNLLSSTTLPGSKVLGGMYSLINGSDAVMFLTTSAYGKNSGFWMNTANTTTSTNAVLLGKANTTTSRPNNFSIYPALNVSSIDTKIDDGLPGTGSIRAADGAETAVSTGDCISATGSTGVYTLSGSSTSCIFAMSLN